MNVEQLINCERDYYSQESVRKTEEKFKVPHLEIAPSNAGGIKAELDVKPLKQKVNFLEEEVQKLKEQLQLSPKEYRRIMKGSRSKQPNRSMVSEPLIMLFRSLISIRVSGQGS